MRPSPAGPGTRHRLQHHDRGLRRWPGRVGVDPGVPLSRQRAHSQARSSTVASGCAWRSSDEAGSASPPRGCPASDADVTSAQWSSSTSLHDPRPRPCEPSGAGSRSGISRPDGYRTRYDACRVAWITVVGGSDGDDGAMDLIRSLLGSHAPDCPHVPLEIPGPSGDRCEECGSRFNLRSCATCGHVGCCESQRGDARRHALASGHPVILSMPAGTGFTWCYEERRYVR